MQINIKGIKPYSYQRDVINSAIEGIGKNRKVIVKSRRQCGKSLLLVNLLLYFSINYSGSTNYCVSPTLKQARKLYRQIVDSGINKIIKNKNATELVIGFINGSQISFKSAEQREALRGETVGKNSILCIDESAYIPDSVYYGLIAPWTDYHKAVSVIVSTPFIKQGFFFKMFQYGLNGENDCLSIDWANEKYKEDLDKILSPETLAQYKNVLPPNVYKSEYLAEWIDDDGLVFQVPEDCIKNVEPKATDRLYVGIDWANQGENNNDDTSCTIFNQLGQMVGILMFNNSTPLRQIDRLCSFLKPYLDAGIVACIQAETNSLGTPYVEMLKERLRERSQESLVVGWNTSNQSKNTLVADMQVALESRSVTFLPDEKLLSEFSYYSAEYHPATRQVTYNAPQGLRDDAVMSTLIAYNALKTNLSTGNYTISFKRSSYGKR